MSITRDVNRVRMGLETVDVVGVSSVPFTNYAASGAVDLDGGDGIITKAGIAALTLALPTSGTEDGKKISITSTTTNAHTVITPAAGINGASTTVTYAAKGDSVTLVAFGGVWFTVALKGATIS